MVWRTHKVLDRPATPVDFARILEEGGALHTEHTEETTKRSMSVLEIYVDMWRTDIAEAVVPIKYGPRYGPSEIGALGSIFRRQDSRRQQLVRAVVRDSLYSYLWV